MKKLAKILTLVLVLALCISGVVLVANADTAQASEGTTLPESITVEKEKVAEALADVYYLVYANEAAFKADLTDNGILDGTGATQGTTGTLTTISAGYIYALKDLTVAAQINVQNLAYVMNLGGNKLIMGAGADIRLSAASKGNNPTEDKYVNAALANCFETFINGTIELADTANGQYFTARAGVSMAFSDVTIKAAEGNDTTTKMFIYDNGVSSLTMNNCTITYGGIIIVDVFGWSGNCSNGTSCTVAKQDTKFNQTYNFNSVTYTSSTNMLIQLRIGQCTCGGNYAINRTVNVTGSSAFNGTFATQPTGSKYKPAYYASADIQVNLQQGTLLSTNWVDTVDAFTGVKVNLLTASGSAASVKENTDANTNAAYPYVVAAPGMLVNWYDADGEIIESTGYEAGQTPSYEAEYDATPKESQDGKKLVGKAPAGWSTTLGGAAAEMTAITDGETERNYYLVLASTEYAIGVYDSEGGTLTSYYADNDLHIANMIKTFAEGSYIKLYSDVEVDKTNRSTNASRRIWGYADGLVFDLNGYELIHTKPSGINTCKRWYTPSAGKTITFKNGTMSVVGSDNLFFGTEYTGSTDGLGTIKLYDIDIVTDFTVGDIRVGTVEMHGGSIEHTSSYVFAMGYKGQANSTAAIKLYGVDVNSPDNTFIGFKLGACTLQTDDDPATFVEHLSNHTLVIEDSTLDVSGLARIDTGSRENVSRNTKISVSVSDSFIKLNEDATFVNLDAVTWVSEDNTAAAANAVLSRSNVSVAFDNVHLGNDDTGFKNYVTLTGGKKKTLDNDEYKVAYVNHEAPEMEGNLTLYTDFALNFNIPKDTNITKIVVNGTVMFDINDPATYEEWDGKYQIKIVGISPNNAAKYVELVVSYSYGLTLPGAAEATTAVYTGTLKYSVINYANDLFAKQNDLSADIKDESVDAMKAILAYVDAAYTYFGENTASDAVLLEKLETLITNYGVADYMAGITPAAPEGDTDLEGVVAAFKVDTITRLYIRAEGKVTMEKEDGTAVVLLASNDDRYDYMVSFRACDLCETYIITNNGSSATFSFGEYATELEDESEELAAILKAMYAYGNAASELRIAMQNAGLIEQ